MDEVTWGALALVLTLVGVLYTWWAFRRRGVAAGARGAALTLLPAAAWLTGTLELATEVAGSVADWATGLVLSPVVWLGIGLGGTSLLLFVVSTVLPSRNRRPADEGPRATGTSAPRGSLPPARQRREEPVVDDDLAEIEAILKRRGIS